MLLSQQASLHRLDERRAVVRVAANWLTMVQSRQALLEKAMLLALGSPRQVTLEASDHPPAHPVSVEPPASPSQPAAPRVELVPQQPQTHQSLAADALLAVSANSEPDSAVNPTRPYQPTEAATSGTQPSALPILGRLETNTRLLADFFQGEVIESSQVEAIETSSEPEHLLNALHQGDDGLPLA
jgi:hypothetical protein